MDKIFMDASKTTKSTKFLVLENFRLYGMTSGSFTLMYNNHLKQAFTEILT